jgi:predicted transcriptional regulator
MRTPSLGDQELALLRYIADHGSISVREVTANYGEPRGLARTTVMTMMERLREKGFLARTHDNGVYRYTATVAQTRVLHNLVQEFVEKTLGGSVSPFVAYLAETRKLTAAEIADLRHLVGEIEGEEIEADEVETAKAQGEAIEAKGSAAKYVDLREDA